MTNLSAKRMSVVREFTSVELPSAADTEAEAFFSHEGGAAVLDGAVGVFTVPI